MSGPKQITLKQVPIYDRALLHLIRHDHERSEAVHPYEITADGLADAIGRRRSDIYGVIIYLVEQGWVEYERHRVANKRRVKTMTLTPAGRAEAARAARVVSDLDGSIEDVIRAPPTMYSDANVLLNRCKVLQDQLDELRRQVESYMEGPR
jgi:DNA-binding MarR family transcriptional regulator